MSISASLAPFAHQLPQLKQRLFSLNSLVLAASVSFLYTSVDYLLAMVSHVGTPVNWFKSTITRSYLLSCWS